MGKFSSVHRKIFLCVTLVFVPSVFSQDTKENADYKLAINLYNDKLYDLALEQFRQFINLYPNTQNGIEARFYLGLTQTKIGKHDDARITFQNFALAYPDNPKAAEAWWNVGEAYVAMNNPREAALAFERVKTFHPKNRLAPAALSRAAEYFELAHDRESAKKVLRTLTQEYGSADILPARLKLAEYMMAENQFEQARSECKIVAEAAKDNNLKAKALLLMADNLARLGRVQEAETALNQIITNLRTSSSYHASLLSLGNLKKSGSSVNEAIAAWKTVADDSLKAPIPIRQDALLSLGDASNALRDFARAFAYFRQAGALKGPRSAEANFRAGLTAERLSNLSSASELYSKAYADTSAAFDRRALMIGAFKAARFSKNYREAVTIAHQYETLFPQDSQLPRLLYESAEIYRKELNDPRRAAELFDLLARRFPQSTLVDAAEFGLGRTLRAVGDYERAVEILESLPKKYPGSDVADKAIAEAERIRIFDIKDRETGQEKLALLIGDVIEQKSKGDLAFRLAEIYFHHLKDFEHAAAQYQSALGSNLEPARRPAAWYFQAKSYEYLASKQGLKNGGEHSKAIACYDSLLRYYPVTEYTDDAQISQFNLRLLSAANPTETRKIGTDFLTAHPNARRKDVALLTLGNSYRSAKSYGDAALTYRLLLEKHPKSDLAAEALFQLGATLFDMGDRDSSVKVLMQFISGNANHARSAEACFLLASDAAEKGHATEALGWFDRIEKIYFYSSFNKNLDAKRGDAFAAAKEYGRAAAYYQKHLQTLANDYFEVADLPAELIYKLADAYDRAGNRSEAKKYYAEYLLRDNSSPAAGAVYYALATIARTENRLDLATKYLQESGRLGTGIGHQLTLETAELLFKNEQYAEALTKFGEVAAATKNDSLQQFLQARAIVCYVRLDNIREADRRITSFAKAYPAATEYVAEFEFERGKYHFRKDELDKARQRFDIVRRQYPKSSVVPDAMYWTARSYELQEKTQFAVQLYDSILQYYSRSTIAPRAQLSLGNVYYTLEQWDAAAKLYKAILDDPARSPDLVQFAMNNLILTYKELNLFDAALDLTRKYIASYPNDPDLIDKKIDIGVLYQKLAYYDQSVVHLQSLLEAGTPDIEPEVRYYIGEAYFYKGDYQQAILEFLKVPYLAGRKGKVDWTATSYYMAGQSYEKMSKYEQAITMYRQIIERPGIDAAFKTAAQREIDRVKTIDRRN